MARCLTPRCSGLASLAAELDIVRLLTFTSRASPWPTLHVPHHPLWPRPPMRRLSFTRKSSFPQGRSLSATQFVKPFRLHLRPALTFSNASLAKSRPSSRPRLQITHGPAPSTLVVSSLSRGRRALSRHRPSWAAVARSQLRGLRNHIHPHRHHMRHRIPHTSLRTDEAVPSSVAALLCLFGPQQPNPSLQRTRFARR